MQMTDKKPEFDLSASEHIKSFVGEYCATQRHPNLQPFIVHGLYTLQSWCGTKPSYRPGCYVIYGEGGHALYIGKASLNASTGSRLAAHLRHIRPTWETPQSVHIIEVLEPFESPSLEEYLLKMMETRHNDRGSKRLKSPQSAEVSVFRDRIPRQDSN